MASEELWEEKKTFLLKNQRREHYFVDNQVTGQIFHAFLHNFLFVCSLIIILCKQKDEIDNC